MYEAGFLYGIPHRFPYREARDGYWGEQTSTLNWCEEDYNFTHYIAEFVNTFSNLIFMWLGAKGIWNCVTYGHSRVLTFGFIGYIIVGLGSMAFHATLKYSMQLADELPMIYTTCIMGFATFAYGKGRMFRLWLGSALAGLAAFITIYYHITKNPVFHQVAYASLMIALVVRGYFVTKGEMEPALRRRSPLKADKIMGQMNALVLTGVSLFLIGFALWNLDNIYCHHLISWRSRILLPWSIVLEGHSWWHLFTGLGAYNLIVWRILLETCLNGKENDFMLQRTTFLAVPEVVPVSEQAGIANKKRV
ncbi:hypothetical protein GGTG_01281 [Gaeumannomyces tritici R3-111a-1]|uniref:Alkaline phytoceramidase n=1 Tax=Gaeumannomyces tritici (strain R3-111a-1) TaxID=644352 RepID=J3NJ48_GAET3|nr:hypothetical protein GGTG_01281 [Gaeumannomyces tritici R3-111a-1]EJT81298.1 hypothetical protein GGTG_01281 [Gaeumannomyces tritici R3-111a-1]